jgi:hypothetical protein
MVDPDLELVFHWNPRIFSKLGIGLYAFFSDGALEKGLEVGFGEVELKG